MTYEDLGVFNNKCTIKYRIYIEKLLSTFAILVKNNNFHSKFDMHLYHTSKPFLIVWKRLIWEIKYKLSCCKKIDLGQSFDLNWWDHITNDKPNMEFVSMLNKIEEHFAFGQIFQLKDPWLEATCCIALLDAIFYR